LASEPEVYKQRFSAYLKKGLRPEEIPERFSVVKDKIKSSFEKKVKAKREET
jgi:large subunit ribosomal protein L18